MEESPNPVSLDVAESLEMPTQLDPATPSSQALTETLREDTPPRTPAKKQRLSYDSSPAASSVRVQHDPYLMSPSTSMKSPAKSASEIADAELEQALRHCLSKPQEPLSRTLRKASDPEALPASLDNVALGQPLPEFSDDVQQRVLSLYVMGLQCGNYRLHEGGQLFHTFSDGFWSPVLERLLQGIMEKFHKEKRSISRCCSGQLKVAWSCQAHVAAALQSWSCHWSPGIFPRACLIQRNLVP